MAFPQVLILSFPFHVEIRELAKRYALFFATLNGFVIDVRQVHYVGDFEAALYQPTLEQILKEKRPKIPNVRKIIHCGAARVHFHFARFQRLKNLFSAC